MEEQQTVSDEQQSSDKTLDQVYKEFNVEETASSFNPAPQAQPAAPQQPTGAEIPDPILDQNGFKSYIAKVTTEHSQALSQLTAAQRQIIAGEMRRREEADIKSAVAQVREKVGSDMDDDFIEIALGQKARKDPRFLSIFQNREKNPAAWRAALGAVGNEMKSKSQFKTDPQLTENVRAAKQSTQSSLTSNRSDNTNPIEQRFENATTQAEFDRLWSQLRG
jgi:hypothetical protein